MDFTSISMKNLNFVFLNWHQVILDSGVTSHYVIDQTTISICDIEKLFGCEVKQNPLDTTWTPMYIKLYDIFQQKLNIVNKITSGPCRH
jgi:hypothetical protein